MRELLRHNRWKMGKSAVSHQLRVMRSQRLVTYRRQGRNGYYGLADDHIMFLYREVLEHLDECIWGWVAALEFNGLTVV